MSSTAFDVTDAPLTIAHVNTHDLAGGAARVMERLCRAQTRRGHTASMCVACKASGWPNSYQLFDALRPHDPQGREAIEAADVIHLHNLHGGYFDLSMLPDWGKEKPLVWTLHDSHPLTGQCFTPMDCTGWRDGCLPCQHPNYSPGEIDEIPASKIWQYKRHIYRVTPNLTIVCPSAWMANNVRQSILGEKPTHVVHNGVETNIFVPMDKRALRRKHKFSEDEFIIGGAAHGGVTTSDLRGGDVVRGILDAIPGLTYLDIGRVPQWREGEAHADRIIPCGQTFDSARVVELMNLLDVFVYPTRGDNCPLVLIEAMACGLPIITSEVGGVLEIVGQESGYTMPAPGADWMAPAVERLRDDPVERGRFGLRARHRAVAEFGLDACAAGYEQIYRRAIREAQIGG